MQVSGLTSNRDAVLIDSVVMPSRVRKVGLALVTLFGAVGCGGGDKPAPVPPLLGGVAAVTAGGSHACALLTDGTARCWGSDAFGELGDGQAFAQT
jgi:alpha-tubulin suppressor-like RCC1 family protein